jgi:peptide chain release factor 2
VKLLDAVKDTLDGYKSCMISIEGEYAYGWCRRETGVHRLVRISPFDAQHRRHTSFAAVNVMPLVSQESKYASVTNIPSSELQIDVFRASGAGGQHVSWCISM